MSRAQQRLQLVRYWWANAEESIASARRELEASAYGYALNRLYYAAFYGASAALLERGISFKRHAGVRSAFHEHFIKTGLLDKKHGDIYDKLFEDRHHADYEAFASFDRRHVLSRLEGCLQLLEQLRPLISSLSQT